MNERRRAQIAFTYLHDKRKDFLARYPQMTCLTFDHVSIILNVFGRMDDGVLRWFADHLGQDLQNKTILDVGANLGNHTLAFAELAKHVYAFEPQPQIFDLLSINCRSRPNITIFKSGASDEIATVRARVREDAFGSTAIVDQIEPGDTIVEFGVRPLDTYAEIDHSHIGLIKFDVEGHEYHAIKGAKALIARSRPIIVFEQDSSVIKNGTSPSIEMLRQFGYGRFSTFERRDPAPNWLARSGSLGRKLGHLLFGYGDEAWEEVPIRQFADRTYPWILARYGDQEMR